MLIIAIILPVQKSTRMENNIFPNPHDRPETFVAIEIWKVSGSMNFL